MDTGNPLDHPVTAAIIWKTGSSSPSGAIIPNSASGSLHSPQIYEHDPAAVSDELRAAILPQYSLQLEAIFNSDAWIQQNQPLDATLIKALLHKVRTGPSHFGCPFQGCSRQDNQSTKATEHIEGHLGHRPFVCDICNWTFRRAKDRDNHHKRHYTGPTKYCPACNAPFVDTKNLSRHLKEYCPSSRV